MGWTDERVAKLRELWGSGKSASEIAEILGGVSRNAVIGKAHRLGLSGRPSPIRKKEEGEAAASARAAAPAPARAAAASAAPAASRTAEPRPRPPTPAARPAPRPPAAAADPDSGGATILNLTERMCRWPIGDPKQPGFRFCGRSSAAGVPYCTEHASVAYQTPNGSKKRDEEKQTA